MAVTAATDPRNENTCINRAGRSVLVDGNSQVRIELLCVSLEHLFRQPPEDEKRCRGDQKGAQEQEAAVYFLWFIHVVGFAKTRNLNRSNSIARSQLDSHEKCVSRNGADFLSRQLGN